MNEPIVIGLVGGKGVGKSSIADQLDKDYGYTQLAFADELKNLAECINPRHYRTGAMLRDAVEYAGWDEAKADFRPFLQDLGTAVRKVDPQYWIGLVAEKINRSTDNHFVVSDVRYDNEARALRETYERCILVQVIRPTVRSDDPHQSEFEHHYIDVDHIVSNDRYGIVPELAQLIAGHVNERWPTS